MRSRREGAAIALLAASVAGCQAVSGFDNLERVDENAAPEADARTDATWNTVDLGGDALETPADSGPTDAGSADAVPDGPDGPAVGCAAATAGYEFCADFEEDPPERGWTREGVGPDAVAIRFDGTGFSGKAGLAIKQISPNAYAAVRRAAASSAATKATLSLKLRAPGLGNMKYAGFVDLRLADGSVRVRFDGTTLQRGVFEEIYPSDGGFVTVAHEYPINPEKWTDLEIGVDLVEKTVTVSTDGYRTKKPLVRASRLGAPVVLLGGYTSAPNPSEVQYDDVVLRLE
jgi:hypothetical protein